MQHLVKEQEGGGWVLELAASKLQTKQVGMLDTSSIKVFCLSCMRNLLCIFFHSCIPQNLKYSLIYVVPNSNFAVHMSSIDIMMTSYMALNVIIFESTLLYFSPNIKNKISFSTSTNRSLSIDTSHGHIRWQKCMGRLVFRVIGGTEYCYLGQGHECFGFRKWSVGEHEKGFLQYWCKKCEWKVELTKWNGPILFSSRLSIR